MASLLRAGGAACAARLRTLASDFEAPVTIQPAGNEVGAQLHDSAGTHAWSLVTHDRPQAESRRLPIPLTWLDGTRRDERWFEGASASYEERDGVALIATDDLLFGMIDIVEDDSIERTVAATYARLQAICSSGDFPHLLRLWNFFGAINGGDGDDERYRRFCVGRARILSRAPASGFPAATAIGIPSPTRRVQISFLASRHAGYAIENPRQTSAWDYPRQFGPVAPGFSRAMLLPWLPEPLLLVSGTASVVGHATVHTNTATQLEESLRNVDMVIAAAATRLGRPLALGRGGCLRIYLRDAKEAAAVSAQLRECLPAGVDWMLLHGDICRADLRVEIELRQACVTTA